MPLFRSKAEDKVRQAGFDPARHLIENALDALD